MTQAEIINGGSQRDSCIYRALMNDYGVALTNIDDFHLSVYDEYVNWVIDYKEGFFRYNFFNAQLSDKEGKIIILMRAGKNITHSSLRRELFFVNNLALEYPKAPNDGKVYLLGPGRIPSSFNEKNYYHTSESDLISADSVFYYKVPRNKRKFFQGYETKKSPIQALSRKRNMYRYVFVKKGRPNFDVLMMLTRESEKNREEYERALFKMIHYKQ